MKKSLALAALAALVAAPAFAQTHVQSSDQHAVTSGTGLMVTPGVPMATAQPMPGATVSGTSTSSTSVVGAGAMPGTTTTTTVVTRHWVNVPPGVEHDPSFQRWMRLK